MGFGPGGRRLVREGAMRLQSSVPPLPPQLRRELPAEQHRVLRPHHRQLGGRDLHGNPALRRWCVCSPREVTGPTQFAGNQGSFPECLLLTVCTG